MRSACADARLRASLALDAELGDLGLAQLRRHLDSCVECTRVVGEMEATSILLRAAAREPYRCELGGSLLVRSCSSQRGRSWAGAAVAVAALVLATGALPRPEGHLEDGRPAGGQARPVVPLKLPIGQRSAVEDFAAGRAPAAVAPSPGARPPATQ